MLVIFIILSVLTAGFFDLRWRRVPNWLVVITILFSLVWHAATNALTGLGMSLGGLALATALLFPLFLLRGMGAGDVKFFGALGAAFTYEHVLTLLVLSIIVNAVFAMLHVLMGRRVAATLTGILDLGNHFLRGRFRPHPMVNIDGDRILRLPFTFSVAVATLMFILGGLH